MFLHFLKKEFTLTFKTPEKAFSIFLFSFLVFLMFSLGFKNITKGSVAGLFWIYILFAGVLRFNQTFDDENEGNVWDLLKMRPQNAMPLFLSKVIFNYVLLLGLSVFFFILQNVLLKITLLQSELNLFIQVVPLALLAFSFVGTLFSGFITGATLKELLFTILFYPLVLPLILICFFVVGEGSSGVLLMQAEWFKFLVGLVIIYCVVSMMMFDYYFRES